MWKAVKLGDVCDFQGGSQPPKKEFVFEPQEGYVRFLQIRDFKSDKNVTYIPIAKKNRLCNTDDILIGRYGASVGQILRGLGGAYNVALMKTIPNEELISKGWLYAYLNSPLFQKPLMEVSSRSAQNGFSKDDISNFELPLPPLAEQQRIVAKLDAAFAEIDRAVEVVSEQLRNSSDVYSAILTEKLNQLEKDTKLGECCSFLNGYAFKSNEAVEDTDVQLLRMGNLYNNVLDLERKPVFYPSEFAQNYSKYVINSGDIVMTLTGTVGKQDYGYAIKVPETDKKLLLNQRILKLHNFDDSRVNQDFLLYVLRSKSFLKELYSTANGTRQANLSSETIKNLKISLPNIITQNKLVRSLQSIELANIAYIDAINQKATELLTLKSAILTQELQPPQSEAA